MTERIFVTDAQVMAAQMLVDRDRALGREPDPATCKIAEARPAYSTGGQLQSRGESRPTAVRFWEALDSAEREALSAVASWRTFAPSSTLMAEGEQADKVIVIFGGRTKVSIDEDGRERVLAVRGLGEVVGERAALQASVRSATVTALDMVWALVVPSEDFVAFVRDHPRVLDILHDQIYDRLTEGPAEYGRDEKYRGRRRARPAHSAATTYQSGGDRAAGRPQHVLEALNGENCTVFLSEVAGFASDTRTDSDRILIIESLARMTAQALQGIPGVWTLDRPDGLLTVLPPSVSTVEGMTPLLKELPAAIERHNRSQPASAQFQMRLAINVGPVFGDAARVYGEAITVASRLLETLSLKEAVDDSAAILGIVISPFVYETFIRPGDLSEVASYKQVPVEVRESSTTAWMKVIPRDPAIQHGVT
jgi:CRP-like cAMP-binding protein